MAVAGVGVGLSTPSIAVQARFSMPSDRVAIVAALTLFVSHGFAYLYSPFSFKTDFTKKNSSDPLVAR
jgi:hypothetical protein